MLTITTASSLSLTERIGNGGFGEVWRAKRSSSGIDQEVAVKILKADMGQQEFEQRLRDEARLLARLKHSSIVKMLDFSVVNGQPAVIMEFVEGEDLKTCIKAGPIPLRPLLQLAVDLASALTEAHELTDPHTHEPLNLIHRDLKPENIRITPRGEVKLLDFGIAKATFEEREAKTGSHMMGSKGYIPPERMLLQEKQVGDVYSLALVLAEAFAGRKIGQCPIQLDDIQTWKEAYSQWQEGLRTKLRGAPESFIRLILRCTAFSPEQRPTMRELERELDELLDHSNGPRLKEWAPELLKRLPKTGSTGSSGRPPTPPSLPVQPEAPDTFFTPTAGKGRGVLLIFGGVAGFSMLLVLCGGGLLLSQVGGKTTQDVDPTVVTKAPLPGEVAQNVGNEASPVASSPKVQPPPVPEGASKNGSSPPTSTGDQPTSSVKTMGGTPAKKTQMALLDRPAESFPPAALPEAPPAVAPTPPPPPMPTTGSIAVKGATARLKGGGALIGLSPGKYKVEVTFSGGRVITVDAEVVAGHVTTLSCSASFETCK